MSIDLGAGQHPLLACLEAIDGMLDEVASIDPTFMGTRDKKTALTLGTRIEARLASVKMRVMSAADDVAETTGARSTAHWLADETRDSPATVRRDASLAAALEARWPREGPHDARGLTRLLLGALEVPVHEHRRLRGPGWASLSLPLEGLLGMATVAQRLSRLPVRPLPARNELVQSLRLAGAEPPDFALRDPLARAAAAARDRGLPVAVVSA